MSINLDTFYYRGFNSGFQPVLILILSFFLLRDSNSLYISIACFLLIVGNSSHDLILNPNSINPLVKLQESVFVKNLGASESLIVNP